ncbi:MAG: hypothetical protein PVF82_05605, partial [Gammaproteobacteria bacterium]
GRQRINATGQYLHPYFIKIPLMLIQLLQPFAMGSCYFIYRFVVLSTHLNPGAIADLGYA